MSDLVVITFNLYKARLGADWLTNSLTLMRCYFRLPYKEENCNRFTLRKFIDRIIYCKNIKFFSSSGDNGWLKINPHVDHRGHTFYKLLNIVGTYGYKHTNNKNMDWVTLIFRVKVKWLKHQYSKKFFNWWKEVLNIYLKVNLMREHIEPKIFRHFHSGTNTAMKTFSP